MTKTQKLYTLTTLISLTLIFLIYLLITIYITPKNTIGDFYSSPNLTVFNSANLEAISSDGFEYEILDRDYGLKTQKFKITYTNTDKTRVFGDVITLKRKNIFSWKVDGYATTFMQVGDKNFEETQNLIEQNLENNDLSTTLPEDNQIQPIQNEAVLSPNGQNSAQLVTDDSGTPALNINGQQIDTNIYHFRWENDNSIIYFKLDLDAAKIIKYSLDSQSTQTLVTENTNLLGFELLQDSLVYTTTNKVGYIKTNGTNQKTIIEFNPPVLNRDSDYVPNIVPGENNKDVTIELFDTNYIENQKVRYIIVNANGDVESDKII